MVRPLTPSVDPRRDAFNRALRTFWQGLLAELAIVLGVYVTTLSTSVQWTPDFWKAAGVGLAQIAVTAMLSYVGRFLTPPKVA